MNLYPLHLFRSFIGGEGGDGCLRVVPGHHTPGQGQDNIPGCFLDAFCLQNCLEH